MSDFILHTQETCPGGSKPLLEKSVSSFGVIPNLHAVMAESPELLESYQLLHTLFQQTSLNAEELTVVWQTINVAHQCHYCVPAHAMIADNMKVDGKITEALINKTELPDPKLQVLHETTLSLLTNRGVLADEELKKFYEAGYTNKQLLEIILGMAQKVISNYTNHLAATPVDQPFQQYAN